MPFSIPMAVPLMAMTFSALEWLACLLLSYLLGVLSAFLLPSLHALSQGCHDDGF